VLLFYDLDICWGAMWRALLSRPVSSINSLSKSPSPLLTSVLAVSNEQSPGRTGLQSW
jgi:hypothetical protein